MECPQCRTAGDAILARSQPRGAYENFLFVWGAEIRRCLNCNSRRAFFRTREIALKGTETAPSKTELWVVSAIAGSLICCAALALWTLSHFYRWPF